MVSLMNGGDRTMKACRVRSRFRNWDKVKRERGYCARCFYRKYLHAHHVVAIADGGPDIESNIEVLCQECHKEWHRIEGLIKFETFLESIPVWFHGCFQEHLTSATSTMQRISRSSSCPSRA
jgi:hypothetical protein